jgi:hypothetical protein
MCNLYLYCVSKTEHDLKNLYNVHRIYIHSNKEYHYLIKISHNCDICNNNRYNYINDYNEYLKYKNYTLIISDMEFETINPKLNYIIINQMTFLYE